MKTYLFQSCGHCWIFQICWPIECSTFTASAFRIWNRSTGILLPPLALFVVMLPEATWLHTRGCLTLGWWSHHRYLLYSSLLQEPTQAPCRLPSPHWQWMLEQLPHCCAMATLVPSPIFRSLSILYSNSHLTCLYSLNELVNHWGHHLVLLFYKCSINVFGNKQNHQFLFFLRHVMGE